MFRIRVLAVAAMSVAGLTSSGWAQSPSSSIQSPSSSQSVQGALSAREAEQGLRGQRLSLANQVLQLREVRGGRVFSGAMREGWLHKLSRLPLEQLRSLAQGDPMTDLVAATSRLSAALGNGVDAPSEIGSTDMDMVFTKVPPCRVVDTRTTGALASGGGTRHFVIAGTEGFEAQGGLAGGCGIPYGATAVAVNLVAVGPSGNGHFRAFPWNTTPPRASVINFTPASLAIANGYIQPLCDPWRGSCDYDVTVTADAAGSHVVIDVTGYFSAPWPTPLDVETFVNSQVAAPGEAFFVTVTCPAGRTATGGGFDYFTPALGVQLWGSGPDVVNGNGWQCRGLNGSALTDTFFCTAQCSRLPGWQ